MPYTANRAFKKAPRLVESARGHVYKTPEGREILDSFSGLWTTGLGHCHPKIVDAIRRQAGILDYASSFQLGHPAIFQLAEKLTALAPKRFTHAFFTNSGSEAVESALKITLGYHRARGEGARRIFIGRERGYHGVNFGGMSVGGIPANRKMFSGALLPNTLHLRTTYDRAKMAMSRGEPKWGLHLADDLERLIAQADASNVAAVIVEPVAGSGGVVVPPIGYLARLREICDRHGVLLIFDEVITAFGRCGRAFASERFGVIPDLITTAKGLTNGAAPMGAVLIREGIYDALMTGPEHLVEVFHGYTYSGHPLATAAALAALEAYDEEESFAASRAAEPFFERAIHALADAPHVVDIRNFALMGAIELAPREGAPGARGAEANQKCFEAGLFIRHSMDTLAFAPFLDTSEEEFARIFAVVRTALGGIA
jgi:beta-alanine--pyruvate transaminase